MKTKITLTINGIETELTSDCLYNWDDVACSYKRTDFSGIVRSFSSQFEFVNKAYDMLLSAYIKHGVKAEASITIYLLNNDWSWSKEFEAALNFSTASWDNNIFTINCIDDTLASKIKARKSTKYEFEIGKDLNPAGVLNYDRMVLQNSCVHEIMGDGNAENGAVLIANSKSLTRLPTYAIHSETYNNSPILSSDQTTDKGSAFVSTIRSAPNAKLILEIWSNATGYGLGGSTESVEIHLKRFTDNDDDNLTDMGVVFAYNGVQTTEGRVKMWTMERQCVGIFNSLDALKIKHPNPEPNVYAIISPTGELNDYESVYYTPLSNNPLLIQWEQGTAIPYRDSHRNGTLTAVYCYDLKYIMEFNISSSGKKYALFYKAKSHIANNIDDRTPYFPIFSKITTKWESCAKPINIQAIKPKALLSALVDKISEGEYNVVPHFSNYDSRLDKTYLLAGESIRDLPGAKMYSSFNDFSEWMETVFGYVYSLGNPVAPQYIGMRDISGSMGDYAENLVIDEYCPDDLYDFAPFFIKPLNRFCIYANRDGGKIYTQWKDSKKYNDDNRIGRKDTIYNDGSHYYIVDEDDNLVKFTGDVKSAIAITQPINFIHRSELFRNHEQDIEFKDVVDLQISVNNNTLYSSIEVGYNKQDYDAECGRDEWNFTNCYDTGIDVIEKKLTLQSKYRADCYGMEFLAQERARDTTDNKSDNNIFFVSCNIKTEESDGEEMSVLEIDRSVTVDGAITDTVFNGEFSPYFCVKANEGYISAMAPDVTLQFASSAGNSDIVIDGVKMSSDIKLTQRLFREIELQFTTINREQDVDFNKLIKVYHNGMSYSGFIKQTECCYARPSDVQYTIIVKDIEYDN